MRGALILTAVILALLGVWLAGLSCTSRTIRGQAGYGAGALAAFALSALCLGYA